MTIAQLFGNDTSDVDEANFEQVFGSLGEGVVAGIANECEVIESAPAAMTVEVRTGTLVTGGVFGQVTAQDVLIIAAADPVNPRIDRVVARRDNATNLWSLAILAGVPAGAPVPTALTRNGTYEISLAQILVGAAVVQINTADITDERHDRSVCGWVTYQGRRQAVEILDRDVSQQVVENDANETTIYSFTIPAGVLGATGGFRLTLGGDVLANVAGTLILRAKLGATTAVQSTDFDFTDAAARYKWTWEILMLNVNAASQKWNTWAQFVSHAAGTSVRIGGNTQMAFMEGNEVSVEDTADPLLLDITVDWSVANLNMSFHKEMAVLELLPPA